MPSTRFARQCLGPRCGAPAKPDAPTQAPPLRFGWLLLASLGNASGVVAVRRPSRMHRVCLFVAALRFASIGP